MMSRRRCNAAVTMIYTSMIVLATSTTLRLTNAVASKSMCVEGCMPICMGLDKATDAACEKACASGCEQLKGKGRSYALPAENRNS